MSERQVAKMFGITTPGGKPNGRMVKHLIDGYIPSNADTLRRCGLFPKVSESVIHDEPPRRVLIGAWKLHGRWVSPEEYFNAKL